MKGYLTRTENFLGKPYIMDNPQNKTLEVGDICMVIPTEKSQSKKPYKVQIVFEYINWVDTPAVEICTSFHSILKKGHNSVLNEYLFSRLKPVT